MSLVLVAKETTIHILSHLTLPLFLGLMLCGTVRAAETTSIEVLKAFRQDLEALKEGQQAIGRDIAEIKKLLQPPHPIRPIDAVLEVGDAPLKGKKDAKLTLIEFSDYQCPFCRRHVETTLPQLEKDYIATGKLRYVFRDFPLESIHAQAVKAAEAAHCAGEQGKYWELHDKLFANQKTLAPENLVAYAKAIGLEAGRFNECLESGKYAGKIKRGIAEGQKLGITGTPTLLLGRSAGDQVKEVKMMVGALPFALYKEEIEKLLAERSDK
ncbi:MAG: DsbA family protein [Gammaproteobacteria bacterium]